MVDNSPNTLYAILRTLGAYFNMHANSTTCFFLDQRAKDVAFNELRIFVILMTNYLVIVNRPILRDTDNIIFLEY